MSFFIAAIFLVLQTGTNGSLIQAAEGGQIEEIRAQAGLTDISLADGRGRTALHAAAENGQREAFAVLVSIGNGDLNNQVAQLRATGQSLDLKLVLLLTQRSRLFNNADRNGVTPLMLAVSRGWIESVRALVEGGASIDARDKDGLIAVDYAVRQGQVEIEVYLRQVRKKLAS